MTPGNAKTKNAILNGRNRMDSITPSCASVEGISGTEERIGKWKE